MSNRRRLLTAIAALGVAVTVVLGNGAGTYATFSDFGNVDGNTASAAIWETNPPTACGNLSNYDKVIYVDAPGGYVHYQPAITTILGWTHPRVIIVTGGNAIINASLGDCIVTGPDLTKVIDPGLASHVFLGSGDSECSGLITLWFFVPCGGIPFGYKPVPVTLTAPLHTSLLITTSTDTDDQSDTPTPDSPTPTTSAPSSTHSPTGGATSSDADSPTPTQSATSADPGTPSDTGQSTGPSAPTDTPTSATPTDQSTPAAGSAAAGGGEAP